MLREQLRERLKTALKTAMKSKDQAAVSTLRMITSSLKEKDRVQTMEQGKPELSDAGIMQMIQTMIKQRHESIKAYSEGGRDDLAAKETAEVALLQSFLPQALEGEALVSAIDDAIAAVHAESTGATLTKNAMGKVIALLKAQYPGQIDMIRASGLVRQRIAG